MKKLMRLAGITTILFSLLAFHGCSSDDTGGVLKHQKNLPFRLKTKLTSRLPI